MTKKSTDARDALPLFADPRYDLYSTVRSKTPERQRFYDTLEQLGWRFDSRRCEWHAPTSGPENNWSVRGRVTTNVENTEAWIQPPGREPTAEEVLNRVPTVPLPILHLVALEDGTIYVSADDVVDVEVNR